MCCSSLMLTPTFFKKPLLVMKPGSSSMTLGWNYSQFTGKSSTRMKQQVYIQSHAIKFFLAKGLILEKWVPESKTVNMHYCKDVLAKLREGVWKKQLELWKNGFIHKSGQCVYSQNTFCAAVFGQQNITTLEPSPYSPDLVLCDCFLF